MAEVNAITVSSKIKPDDGIEEGQLKFRKISKTNRDFLCCKYTGDNSIIAAGTTLGTLELFNAKNFLHFSTLIDDDVSGNNKGSPLTDITVKKKTDNTILCCYNAGILKNWSQKTLKCNYTIREQRQIFSVKYHPHQQKFITLGDDGVINMYDEKTYKLTQSFMRSHDGQKMDGHTNRVFAACFNPINDAEFITGGWDRTVQFWDTRSEHSVRHLSDVYICGDGLDISRTGKEVLTCAWIKQDNMRIYDYKTLSLARSLTPDENSSLLYCGRFLGHNYLVTGGTNVNLMRVVDLRLNVTVAVVKQLPGAVYSLDVQNVKSDSKQQSETIMDLPNVLFCAAKNLYEIKFVY